MRVKELYFFLFCFLITGCNDKPKKATLTENVADTTEIIVSNTSEIGLPCCYLTPQGDTVVPFGKYRYAGSDTIQNIGFVLESHTPGWTVINNKGEKLFYAFSYDNGPDYVEEGLFRIINHKRLIGFADTLGNIVIKPQFAFAFPFNDGKAKVTFTGQKKKNGEYYYWDSDDWYYLNKQGKISTICN